MHIFELLQTLQDIVAHIILSTMLVMLFARHLILAYIFPTEFLFKVDFSYQTEPFTGFSTIISISLYGTNLEYAVLKIHVEYKNVARV